MATYHLQHNRVHWINIVHPTPNDVELLRSRFPFIHPLNLEDILSSKERPKIDEDDDYLFLVLHFPQWDPIQRLSRSREVDIILAPGTVVTIHDGTLKPLLRLFQKCENEEETRQRYMGRGANYTFYVILDELVDYLFPILRKVDKNIQALEEEILGGNTRNVIREITLTRRDVITLRRIIRQQVPVLEDLEKTDHPLIMDDYEEYFNDLVDHMHRARDFIDEDAEIVASLSETADTLASHRINEVMQILTVISVTMLPLTLISSVYGMNIPLPLQNNPYSFIFVSASMVIVAILMLIYFVFRGWL